MFLYLFQKSREKGRIDLNTVHTVETALTFHVKEGESRELCPFLVGYHYEKDYNLFLLAHNENDRYDWILAIREGKILLLNHNGSVNSIRIDLD